MTSDPSPHSPDPLSENLLLTIMQEISRDAVLSIDPDGHITSWNAGAETLLGYTADEVIGRHFEFMVPEDLQRMGEVDRLLAATEREGFLRDYETRRVRKDGTEIHVSLVRMRLLDPDGRLLGATAVLSDITSKKRMADELVRSQTLAAIGEFAARIAHEVKNPLTGISSALSLITRRMEDLHPDRGLYDEIQDQIRRIDRILDDLLTFARHRQPVRQSTDLVLLLEKVLTIVAASGELSGIELVQELPDEAVVSADPSMVQDCLFNLIHNALQSMQTRGGGRLELTIEDLGDRIRTRVVDDGPGIPDDVRTKIFDPFFTTKVRGTGLGLPICRKHAEAHGGSLDITSARGSATCFDLVLPRDEITASLPDDDSE